MKSLSRKCLKFLASSSSDNKSRMNLLYVSKFLAGLPLPPSDDGQMGGEWADSPLSLHLNYRTNVQLIRRAAETKQKIMTFS